MKIKIVVVPDDESDIDENDDTGLTNEAFGRLIQAVVSAGFGWEYVAKEEE